MAISRNFWLLTGISLIAAPTLAQAQTEAQAQEEITPAAPVEATSLETSTEAGPETATMTDENLAEGETAEDGTIEVDPDEMADMLNSSQQLQQSFTLKRTINGELVETEKRTVTYSRDEPYRQTEAGETIVERLKSAFDGEALTRTEAFEEAKLDFVIADLDRDNAITAQEFAGLVESWRDNEARLAEAPTEEIARQRQYDAFLEELDPSVAKQQTQAYALEKFAFMAGAATSMSLQDYVREYLLDFDSMDADHDTVLKGDELMRFRAINRGETLDSN